ncbi:MAG TPA: ABC transporter ATP-binding protein [Metabacillus sp.]|nr:ABC transporter ATP-binding protein [Metabacillus sp.]
MFELKDVKFKDIISIRSLHIPKGKITCFVGESGAGKSTLMKMLNIMLSPDQGEIYYNGENISEIDPIHHRRRVIMLEQQPTIFEGTVRDNLNIGLVFSGEDRKSDKELLGALHLVSLQKELDEEAQTLSGGEKQRLALARVYLIDAEVYLLDEPTSALDKETEEKVMKNFFSAMKERKKTIVFISHSNELISTYGENKVSIAKHEVKDNG